HPPLSILVPYTTLFRSMLTMAVCFFADLARAQAGTAPLSAALEVSPGATCLDHERLQENISGWLGASEVARGIAIQVQGSPLFRSEEHTSELQSRGHLV